MTHTETISISLDTRSYDIQIGAGLMGAFNIPGPARVMTDETVAGLYLDKLNLDMAEPIVVPSGEGSKSFARYESVVETLLAQGVERGTTLIALGGGVVGDLTGFVAATVLRGIPYVQMPTTLLAQVDSSVGGKTAINSKHGKNLVGAFYQPQKVIIDTDTLKTLPKRELLAGYAEVYKYGLINNPGFFEWCEGQGEALIAGDDAAQTHAIKVSCETKADIVAADEREGGVRALLNLGHTFGHALENLGGYGALLHGEAVAIGMIMAFDLSVQLGLCPAEDAARVRAHTQAVGLPVTPPFGIEPEAMWQAMTRDKKVQDGQIRFILARGIGDAFQSDGVDKMDVISMLELWI